VSNSQTLFVLYSKFSSSVKRAGHQKHEICTCIVLKKVPKASIETDLKRTRCLLTWRDSDVLIGSIHILER
jgi:hypothetical protein